MAILSFNILRHSDMQKGEKPIRLIFPSGHILWNDQNLHHHYQHNHHYHHHISDHLFWLSSLPLPQLCSLSLLSWLFPLGLKICVWGSIDGSEGYDDDDEEEDDEDEKDDDDDDVQPLEPAHPPPWRGVAVLSLTSGQRNSSLSLLVLLLGGRRYLLEKAANQSSNKDS